MAWYDGLKDFATDLGNNLTGADAAAAVSEANDANAQAYADANAQRAGAAQQAANQYATTGQEYLFTTPDGQPMYGTVDTGLGSALKGLAPAYDQAYVTQAQGMQNALSALGAAPGMMSGALNQYGTAAQDAIGGYLGAAGQALAPQQQLTGYAAQAAQGPKTYDLPGQFDQRMSNFQADPGYQFRQQQGEEAINRAAAASGGRISGRTLKDLASFNQNLASQEFGNVAGRNMSLLGSQAGAENQAGLATQGIQAGLGQLGYQAGGQMAGMLGNAGSQVGSMLGSYGSQMGSALGNLGGQIAATNMTGYGALGQLGLNQAQGDVANQQWLAAGRAGAIQGGAPQGAPPPVQAVPPSGLGVLGGNLINTGLNAAATYGLSALMSPGAPAPASPQSLSPDDWSFGAVK